MRQQNLLNHFPQQKKSTTSNGGTLDMNPNNLTSHKQKTKAQKLTPSFNASLVEDSNEKHDDFISKLPSIDKYRNLLDSSPAMTHGTHST